ncbi:MAG: hypothetical protein HXY27_00070 [Hydrogenophilaceae bacterium]|nr:hypothetical protein [Hydrogenophilaceae bacterium]
MSGIRVKTNWFREGDDPRGPQEQASAFAITLWKLADKAVINLSNADYDIITPQRGFTLLAELIAYMVQIIDRMVHGRIDDEERAELIGALGVKMAEILESNIHDVMGDHDYPYVEAILDKFNRRWNDYASFEFNPENPNFQVKRYLANCIREVMEARDQSWIADQIIEIEAPAFIGPIKKQVEAFYPKHCG